MSHAYTCRVCGASFRSYNPSPQFCSLACCHAAPKPRRKPPLTCPVCQKSFHAYGTKRRYCSTACAYRDMPKTRVEHVCAHCGKVSEFETAHAREKIYCGRECYMAARLARTKRVCGSCGKEFFGKPPGAKYCDERCQAEGRKKRVRVTCETCSKVFMRSEKHAEGARFCSKECYAVGQRKSVTLACLTCQKPFTVIAQRKDTARFCSRRCKVHYRGETTLELTIRAALETLGLPFKQEEPFGNGKSNYSVDFYLPGLNVALEADGFYWHSERADHDAKRDAYLKRRGVKTVRISDRDLIGVSCVPSLIASRLGIKWQGQLTLSL